MNEPNNRILIRRNCYFKNGNSVEFQFYVLKDALNNIHIGWNYLWFLLVISIKVCNVCLVTQFQGLEMEMGALTPSFDYVEIIVLLKDTKVKTESTTLNKRRIL